MKRIITLLFALALCLSCAQKEADYRGPESDVVFYASLEQPADPETRVYADEDLMVLWHADDRVSVFNRYTYNDQYRFTGETGDNSGTFTLVPNDAFTVGNKLPAVYAVYPYQTSTRISNQCQLTVMLPSEQVYADHSFGPGANAMVSATEDNNLMFKNLGGYLVLKLYGADASVSSVTLKGNLNEPLAGKALVDVPLNGDPGLELQAGATMPEVTLACPTPVALAAAEADYDEFWFVLPPTTFSQGFTITVTGPGGGTFVKSTAKAIVVERNQVIRMAPVEVRLLGGATPPSSEIWYTTTDGQVLSTNWPDRGVYPKLVSNTYEDGRGVLVFDAPVDRIPHYAFSNASTLETVCLPEAVRRFDGVSFFGCPQLTEVSIPGIVTSHGVNPFHGCKNLTTITGPNMLADGRSFVVDGCLVTVILSGIASYEVPSGINALAQYVFGDCSDMTVVIPESLEINRGLFGYWPDHHAVDIRLVLPGRRSYLDCFMVWSTLDGTMEPGELVEREEALDEINAILGLVHGYCMDLAEGVEDEEERTYLADKCRELQDYLLGYVYPIDYVLEDPMSYAAEFADVTLTKLEVFDKEMGFSGEF